jgi:RNA recognition motif. (a.k.a. RRM, RBD, or RNP domain)
MLMILKPLILTSAKPVPSSPSLHSSCGELNHELSEIVYIQSRRRPGCEEEYMKNNLLIVGLPVVFTERQLGDMIWPYGTVVSAKIARLRNGKGHPVALGVVKMSSSVGARKVVNALDGNILNGHYLYVYACDLETGSHTSSGRPRGLL